MYVSGLAVKSLRIVRDDLCLEGVTFIFLICPEGYICGDIIVVLGGFSKNTPRQQGCTLINWNSSLVPSLSAPVFTSLAVRKTVLQATYKLEWRDWKRGYFH